MRVVSLVPSVTESLLAWGIRPVAVTRFCEQAAYPTVGGTKNPDLAAIVALAPDLVVMDEEENRREDADALRAAGVPVHVTAVRSVDDVAPTLEALARAVGASPAGAVGRRIAGESPARAVSRRIAGESPAVRAPRAFVPIWRRPWMTINADTYGSSLLARAGVGNVAADLPERYPRVELADIAALHPDVALVPTEPYDFSAAHVAELGDALGVPTVVVDGRDLFWWGVRTEGARARLAALLGAA